MARTKRKANPLVPELTPATSTARVYKAAGYVRLSVEDGGKPGADTRLTEAEALEQARLRAQYLKEFRANMEATLQAVRVEQADGSYKPLVKKEKMN